MHWKTGSVIKKINQIKGYALTSAGALIHSYMYTSVCKLKSVCACPGVYGGVVDYWLACGCMRSGGCLKIPPGAGALAKCGDMLCVSNLLICGENLSAVEKKCKSPGGSMMPRAGRAHPHVTEGHGPSCLSLAWEALSWEALYAMTEIEEFLARGTLHLQMY